MARHASGNGGVGGWFVCDQNDLDRTNLARPIHEEPCADETEAKSIAAMLNDENNSWGDKGPRPEWN